MSSAQTTSASSASRARLFLYFGALLVALGLLIYYNHVRNTEAPAPLDEMLALRTFISKLSSTQKLADGYSDADGDLVADRPTDAAKVQKVETLGFCAVAGDDPEEAQQEWQDLMAALAKATGKKVEYRGELSGDEQQRAALRGGTLHVVAFSTGDVAEAVNTAGFVPLAAPADTGGKYAYEMEILVPAASSARTPADLKGKTIAFTSLSSNSGAKAPLVVLKDKFGMLPGRDYSYVATGGHARSIKDLAAGKHDAVCIANDLLAQAVVAGDIKADAYRSIYKSATFPPLCVGVAYNLPPELTAQVKQALVDFQYKGTSLDKRFAGQGKVRFAPVDYRSDWAYVRDIDSALLHLFDADKQVKATAAR
jgi:phosphonate transport system substrate-binding protein